MIFQQWMARLSSELWIRDVANPVSDEVEGEDRHEYGEAGKEGKPGCIGELVKAVPNHGSPARSWRSNSEPDETEAGLDNNGRGYPESAHHQNFSEDIRQDMN